MPRHTLTIEEQIKGLEKALANPKTPPQFRKSLQARLAQLRKREGK
jgi:hypothetical protein